MNEYAARIDDGVVTQIIVGTAEWATDNLGGTWVQATTEIGVGWTWDGFEFSAPAVTIIQTDV